ncbi:MAG: AMP-binding protein [Nitriliruptoraceae bacterium]
MPAPDAAITALLTDPTAPSRPLHALAVEGTEVADALPATWAAGAAAVVLPTRATARERTQLLELLRPAAVVTRDAHGGLQRTPMSDGVDVDGAVALLVATSGSTGRRKAVALSAAALDASVRASLDRLGARPGQRWGLALPTHHVAGLSVLLRARALGTRAVPAADTAAVADLDVEHVALVPTQLADLLAAGATIDRFTTILLGGARPDPELLTQAAAAGARVVVSYGMTETVGGCVYDGVPLDGVEVACTPAGRIRLRGPVLLQGLRTLDERGRVRDRPGLDADGWFTTSDLGHLDRGRLVVTGRADEVLVSGGVNVPLAAVRAAVASHPGVAEAAVTALADARWGQVPAVVVVAADPTRPPTLDALRAHVKQQAPVAYAPRCLVVVPALPRDGLGKVTRVALDALIAAAGPTRG